MHEKTTSLNPVISVIVPCHNPRRDYLQRVLEALRGQTLPQAQWELVLVDNASDPALSEGVDVSWHPRGRMVREETLGLTAARLRGFSESSGDLLVMVDDDNVLAADYLEQACRIARTLPAIGAFGGSIAPGFDEPPPEWTRPHWSCLAIRPCERDVWSNDINHWDSTPSGAGMCVCREVADCYAAELRTHPLRAALDRSGASLVSGGDTDLAWTACAMGLGMGRFPALRLTHLIPPSRMTPEYLSRLHEGLGYSAMILNRIWNRADPNRDYEGFKNLVRSGWRRFVSDFRNRRFLECKRRGEARALKALSALAPSGDRASAGRA